MAPGQDGEWVDTPGCNDSGSRQQAVLHEELNGAEQVAVVVKMNLKTSTDTSQHLCQSTLPARIAGGAAAQIRADNTLMVVHNRELIKLGLPLRDQAGFDADAEENVGEREAISREQLRDVILQDHL